MQNPDNMFTQLTLDDIHGVLSNHASTQGNDSELASATYTLLARLRDCTEDRLAECNQAILDYLADRTNQDKTLYRLFMNALIAKVFGAEGLPLDPEAAKTPIIAGLTAWQLRHFYQGDLQTTVLNAVALKYQTKKRDKTQSAASRDLSECLASDKSPDAKWQALVSYCCDPENKRKKRTLFTTIESCLKDISITRTCHKYYNDTCRLIKAEATPENALINYQQALRLLTIIPTCDRRVDSPLGLHPLLAAYSEICERTNLNKEALDALVVAYPDHIDPDELNKILEKDGADFIYDSNKKQRLAQTGLSLYATHFPGDSEARKVRLFITLFKQALSNTALTENANSVANQRFMLFTRPFKSYSFRYAMCQAGMLTPLLSSYALPPALPFALGATVAIGGILLGSLATCSIYGGVHAATRNPLDSNGLHKLMAHLQQLDQESEKVKHEFLASVVARYYAVKNATCSRESMKLLQKLENHHAPVSKRWNDLLYYMAKDDYNNGKKMFTIISALLEEYYPAQASTRNEVTAPLLDSMR
jgi:hypothetical protein